MQPFTPKSGEVFRRPALGEPAGADGKYQPRAAKAGELAIGPDEGVWFERNFESLRPFAGAERGGDAPIAIDGVAIPLVGNDIGVEEVRSFAAAGQADAASRPRDRCHESGAEQP